MKHAAFRGIGYAVGMVLLVACLGVVDGARASQCACRRPETSMRRQIREADGAIVARYLSDSPSGSLHGDVVRHELEVLEAPRGLIDSRVVVYAPGGVCGIDGFEGDLVGLLLDRDDDGRWLAHGCRTVEVDGLLRAVGLPTMAERGPPAFLLDEMEPGALMTVDREGRRLVQADAYGRRLAVGLCSGGRAVAELAQDLNEKPIARVRSLPSLDAQWQHRLRRLSDVAEWRFKVEHVGCADDEGTAVLVLVSDYGPRCDASPSASMMRLVRVSRDRESELWAGCAIATAMEDERSTAWFALPGDTTRIVAVDARGHLRQVARIPMPVEHIGINTDGTRLAAFHGGIDHLGGKPASLWFVPAAGGKPTEHKLEVPGAGSFLVWSSPELVTVGRVDDLSLDAAETYDLRGTRLARWTGMREARDVSAMDGVLYVLRDEDHIVKLSPLGEELERISTPFPPAYAGVVALPAADYSTTRGDSRSGSGPRTLLPALGVVALFGVNVAVGRSWRRRKAAIR